MVTEGVYVKKEYAAKVKILSRKMRKVESEVRQSALELGVDTLLEMLKP